ncbi:MAG: type VI secretion system tube protein Hcp [Gemmatimonadota bacterium]|nr:type VI secretion system tube protein Hcp [Gemmatimonadota bacterium]
MLVDYFLKIDGIEGESGDAKHKGEIELESFSFGGSQAGTAGYGGGGGAGKVQLQDFHFIKKVDKASAKLFLHCCNGQHIKMATLVARKAGKDQQEYLKITLSDCMVSSFTAGGSQGSVVPSDQISLNFSKVEMEYKEQKADGSLAGAVKSGWDVKSNKAV